jgi:TetR/AcrR family transcriptional regulator, transcriptional repressor for nem operon
MSDTKEHILDVSLSLFLQKTFKEVTMQDIVEKTGMSKGAFYHYFESKEQLFLEVINYFASAIFIDYSKLSKDSLYQFYHDYIKCLNDTIFSFLQKINDMPDSTLNYYRLMFDAIKLFPGFQERIRESFQVELKAWEEMVRSARDKGEIKASINDEQIAKMFIYTCDGVGMHNIMIGNIENMTNTLLALWNNIYKGLKT